METTQKKIAVIVYGAPGAGKGTQANLLAAKFGLIHVDTGRLLESILHDPKRQKEKIVRRERKLFDGGQLNSPSFVTQEIINVMEKIHAAGYGAAFSGSPRTLYEAERFYPAVGRLYGRKNIYVFVLAVPPESSLKRNSARRICTTCGYELLTAFYPTKNPKHCPVCGGKFYKRSLDKPSIIKVRLKEYAERTEPVFEFAKKHGYPPKKIDGTPAPYLVFQKLEKLIK
jgi:adenylate kinase